MSLKTEHYVITLLRLCTATKKIFEFSDTYNLNIAQYRNDSYLLLDIIEHALKCVASTLDIKERASPLKI